MSKYDFEVDLSLNSSTGIILNKIKKNSLVLEFGCAHGRMTRYMQEQLDCKVYIVECDKEAFESAMAYAEDGICDDILNFQWLDKFQGMQFDAIIFADVLEHLNNPEKVLQSAAQFLNDKGAVYVSIPNINHNDILLKAYDGNFDYTKVGLLDDSHIRFWGMNNLKQLSEKSGLNIRQIEATYCPTGYTEQYNGLNYWENQLLVNILKERKFGEVYQFIVTMDKCVEKICSSIDSKPFILSNIYLDTGNDFNADEVISIESSYSGNGSYHLHYVLEVSDDVKKIRIDPVENQSCILQQVSVTQENTKLFLDYKDAIILDNMALLQSTDPMVYADIILNGVPIIIDMEIIIPGERYFALVQEWLELKVYKLKEAMQTMDSMNNDLQAMKTLIANNEELSKTNRLLVSENREYRQQIEEQQKVFEDGLLMLKKQYLEEIQDAQKLIKKQEKEIEKITEQLKEKETIFENLALEYERKAEDLNRHEKEKIVELENELAHYKLHYHTAINQRTDLTNQCGALTEQLNQMTGMYMTISNSTCWKMTAPIRNVLDSLKAGMQKTNSTRLLYKGLASLKNNGFDVTWHKTKQYISGRKELVNYNVNNQVSEEELQEQRDTVFLQQIKFSILVPLYNTPEQFLHEMIQSVQAQTYGNWELCLADGSDSEHKNVGTICKQYIKKDKRIVYKKLEKNLGISGNTNACIEISTGDYIGLFDHDDLLHPSALYEVMKVICDKDADFIYTDENTFHDTPADAYCPHFKPDYAPDTLRSYNYICHFTVFRKELLQKTGGGFRSEFDGSQDYDMILRLTEQAERIVHIPKILYYWRSHSNSVASDISAKPYTVVAAKKALQEHLGRKDLAGEVLDSTIISTYRIKYEIVGQPLISIIIPNKDHIDDLDKCIRSILNKSTYSNWEIIIVENNSTDETTFAYYEEIQRQDNRIHVVYWKDKFNYSAINNFGAKYANGEYLLLLNNDVEVLTESWLEEMLMFAQRNDVGAVGAMLYYPDDTVQHAGVILGIGGVAGHAHKYFARNDYGYMSRLTIAQNYSAVTAACLMMSREVWDEIDGLDETFEVAFNDVDLCMRIRQAGYLIVWTPFAELYHYESKSRGLEDTPEKQKRFEGEVHRFQGRWGQELANGDPYYNLNFTLDREDFSLR